MNYALTLQKFIQSTVGNPVIMFLGKVVLPEAYVRLFILNSEKLFISSWKAFWQKEYDKIVEYLNKMSQEEPSLSSRITKCIQNLPARDSGLILINEIYELNSRHREIVDGNSTVEYQLQQFILHLEADRDLLDSQLQTRHGYQISEVNKIIDRFRVLQQNGSQSSSNTKLVPYLPPASYPEVNNFGINVVNIISKISVRVSNIEQGGKAGGGELQAMLRKIDTVKPSNEKIVELRNRILALLSSDETIGDQYNGGDKSTTSPVVPGVYLKDTQFGENQEFAVFINGLLSNGLSHNLSTTKDKGSNSVGDGSFVMKVLKPILQQLKAILRNNTIDISNTSWQELIGAMEAHTDDGDDLRRAFRGELKKNTKTGDWKTVWLEGLLGAIEETSRNARFSSKRKTGKLPLSNVREFLRNNPPQ